LIRICAEEKTVLDYDQYRLLGLSLQRALLGEVSANVYAVGAGIVEHTIHVFAVYYVSPTDEEDDDFASVVTQVIADFPSPYTIEEASYIMPVELPKTFRFWAFLRKGNGLSAAV
jgi:hypothetical protein